MYDSFLILDTIYSYIIESFSTIHDVNMKQIFLLPLSTKLIFSAPSYYIQLNIIAGTKHLICGLYNIMCVQQQNQLHSPSQNDNYINHLRKIIFTLKNNEPLKSTLLQVLKFRKVGRFLSYTVPTFYFEVSELIQPNTVQLHCIGHKLGTEFYLAGITK